MVGNKERKEGGGMERNEKKGRKGKGETEKKNINII